ncbi:hypothetical protein XELAEV_18011963mg [Xenopus laevis]|uniref:Uncharacterized protein n=1 Tax=Xenopus laevis TaxID=8355 RepID=A0A974HXZ0_XENLA|nr:hypothetical protein XELAEV_18011963mg [Xenopus laevis]
MFRPGASIGDLASSVELPGSTGTLLEGSNPCPPPSPAELPAPYQSWTFANAIPIVHSQLYNLSPSGLPVLFGFFNNLDHHILCIRYVYVFCIKNK